MPLIISPYNEFFSTAKNIHRKDKNYSLQSKSKDTLIELTKYIKENRKESAEEILLLNRDFIVIALEKNLGSRRISEALKQSRGIYISHTSINDFIHRYNLRDKKVLSYESLYCYSLNDTIFLYGV